MNGDDTVTLIAETPVSRNNKKENNGALAFNIFPLSHGLALPPDLVHLVWFSLL
jgi:hypothetical protein